MKTYKQLPLITLLISVSFSSAASSCTLTMGFRTTERLPLIDKAPFNNGLYWELYSRAAEAIGCRLEVIRAPKNRILKKLENGEIDFYPGFVFNSERANYTYFIQSGLPSGEMGISHLDVPEITDKSQLAGYTLLRSLGAPSFVEGIEGIEHHVIPEMSVPDAFTLLRKRRADFYIYPAETLLYYLAHLHHGEIKLHPNCCGGEKPLYLGFSRRSEYIEEDINLEYDLTKPVSTLNFPTVLNPDSIAAKFESALQKMKQNGETRALFHSGDSLKR